MTDGSVSNLFRALVPVGTVKAVRQEYEVFRTAGGDYLIFSPSRRGTASFHMTMVEGTKVGALEKTIGKQGATTGSLMKDGRLEEAFGSEGNLATRFDLLMALYVLTAQGKVEMTKEGRNLVFHRKTSDD